MTAIIELTPLDRYLAEQQQLTAVGLLGQRYDEGLRGSHRELVPLSRPSVGQQYAFEVDLDACTGCKSCVSACHSLNGLDEDESWRSVGLLYGAGEATPFLQTVTTACHHCVEPACMSGCPVNAYEKDTVTGIVRHLDDQCIGCSYCTLTCPYEVPRFNTARGIVRKCDLCSDRLDAGEAPACVQACPTKAIRVTIVETAAAVEGARSGTFMITDGQAMPMPTAPSPRMTVPTTRYVTRRQLPTEVMAADHFSVRPSHSHSPLAAMLVLTQLSVGAFVADLGLRAAAGTLVEPMRQLNALAALVLGVLALGVSLLHLGRPLYAFRAVLGIRTSWLSREIVAFGAFAALAAAYAGALWAHAPPRLVTLLAGLVSATGLAGVASSVMVYAVTGRRWWRARSTAPRFASTTLVCGLAAVLLTATATGAPAGVSRPVGALLALICASKLAWEATIFRHLPVAGDRTQAAPSPGVGSAWGRGHHPRPLTDLGRTALLMARDLHRTTFWRFMAGGAGVALALLAAAAAGDRPLAAAVACLALVAVVAGELLERLLFFRACTAPSMPGGLS
ncbi:MAG: DmsC/YnfH family molybdoenzyme membrane anchor subunit [Egibacteraceae bacterium]